MKRDLKALIGQMTLEEKASLCSGSDFWHTQGIERLGIPAVMVTDGPHGLRKQAGEADRPERQRRGCLLPGRVRHRFQL